MGNMIFGELCKRLKYNHDDKLYMNKSEYLRENETHTILLVFEIQTDSQISARRTDQVLINKKKRICHLVDFAVPVNHCVKIIES